MSARPVVDLDVPPYAAELDCWGQCSGGWWALVTWCELVVQEKQMMRRSAIMCSGWAAAPQVRPRSGEDYSEVPHVELPDDEVQWPRPTNRGPRFWWPADAHHVGVLTRQRYELPAGYTSLKATPA
jgi:hypothetical protein